MTRLFLLLMLLFSGVALPPSAGAQTIDPAFEREIKRLLDVTGAQKLSEQMMQNFITQFAEGMRQGAGDSIPPRAIDVMAEVVRETFQRNFEALVRRIVAVYAKLLTPEDVRQMLAFYETPLGRRMIEVMPRLAQAGNETGAEWGRELTPGMLEELQRRLKAEGFVP